MSSDCLINVLKYFLGGPPCTKMNLLLTPNICRMMMMMTGEAAQVEEEKGSWINQTQKWFPIQTNHSLEENTGIL